MRSRMAEFSGFGGSGRDRFRGGLDVCLGGMRGSEPLGPEFCPYGLGAEGPGARGN